MPNEKYLQGNIVRSWIAPEGATEEVRLQCEEARKTVEKTRKVLFVISSDARDRHKSRLNMKNWKLDNYNRNGIVGYQHNVYGDNMCSGPNPDDVIGNGRAFMDGDKLMGEVTFESGEDNPLAEKIFKKVLNGILNATSVGFLPVGEGETKKERDQDSGKDVETYFYAGQELLEFSVVNIPSNPEATKKSLVNHTRAGIGFLTRMGIKVSEIRKIAMDILNQLEESEQKEEGTKAVETDGNKLMERFNKRKNKL